MADFSRKGNNIKKYSKSRYTYVGQGDNFSFLSRTIGTFLFKIFFFQVTYLYFFLFQ